MHEGNSAVAAAIGLLRDELSDRVRISDVAARMYISAEHLSRVFKHETGLPPATYLTAIRMERAAELLLQTNLSVTAVSQEVGYDSLGTFMTRFRQFVGMTPRQFRCRARCLRAGGPGARAAGRPHVGTLAGVISGPPGAGPIFIGIFDTPLPAGAPVACCHLRAPGPFRLEGVPPGDYYMLAAAKPAPRFPGDLLGADFVAAWEQGRVLTVTEGAWRRDLLLTLRARRSTDPPVLGCFE